MSKHPSLNDVVKDLIAAGYYGLLSEDPGHARWNKKVREFFKRWLDNEDDKELWDTIAAEAERDGISRQTCFRCITTSAAGALFESDPANANNFTAKDLRLQSGQFLHLAQCAQALADHYGKCGEIFGQVAQWYEKEAQKFRWASDERLEQISGSTAGRQSHGTKFNREHLLFMRCLVTRMRRHFGQSYYEAVEAIANIAYPRSNDPITREDVRTACKGLSPVDRVPFPPDLTNEEAEAVGKMLLEALDQIRKRGTGKLDKK
jgi:hypothetical protein